MTKNQGFSLVGVMVASGVGLTIITALSTHLLSNARMVRHLESKMESMQLKQELTLLLTNDINCDDSFKGMTVNVGNSTGGNYTNITQLITGANPLLALKNSYSDNNRFINVTEVGLLKPQNKLSGLANTTSPYEFKVQMIVREKGGLGMSMRVDGPTVILTAPGGSIPNDATACENSGTGAPLTLANVCTSLGGTLTGTQCALPTTATSPTSPLYQCPYKPSGYSSSCNGQLTSNATTCSWQITCGRGGCSSVTETCPRIN